MGLGGVESLPFVTYEGLICHNAQFKDFPDDPSGEFDEFKNFVKSNFEFCKWIGLLIVATQVWLSFS
ncbi:hypothetical protein Scep_011281 [Stephania cephalantha]|uniref:Uncharacterized protein n=1 Tax=Stephania cephalantha TaxID=152367 RepID=A0AAP0P5Q1_9MAGN